MMFELFFYFKLKSSTCIDVASEVFVFDGFEILSRISWGSMPLVHHLGERIIYGEIKGESKMIPPEVRHFMRLDFFSRYKFSWNSPYVKRVFPSKNWNSLNPIYFMSS